MRTLFLLLLFAPAIAAEPLNLETGFTEDGASIRVRVEGAFPRRAVITLRILAEVGSAVPPFELRDQAVCVREAGRAEALVLLPESGRGLRAYRVTAAIHANRQYPEVSAAFGGTPPAPAERLLTADLASLERLRAITDEEAFVRDLLDEAGRFLVRMNEGKSGGPAAIEAWRAWREAPRTILEAGVRRGRADQRRIFPSVNSTFCNRFVQTLLTTEAVWLARAEGIPVMGDEALGACSERDLEPFAETFRKESLEARLESLQALVTQAEKTDRARWDKRRAGWDAWLALWPANLDRLTQGKDLDELGKALKAWLDSPSAESRSELSKRFDALTPAPSRAP